MDNQTSTFDTITNMIKSYFGAQLQGIMLYGSRAKGTHKPESDYDLAIMCDQNISGEIRWELAQNLAATLNHDVDLVDLWQAPTVLRKEVVENGVWLYQRDKSFCDEFVTHTWSQYQNLNMERRDIIAGIKQRLRQRNG